jgi:hypothetical protein
MKRTAVHEMVVRWVRHVTNTAPEYTVVRQVQERGRCIWKWYIEGWDDYPGADVG